MKLNATTKSFLLILACLAGFVAIIFYLVRYQPAVGNALIIGLLLIAGIFVLYVTFSSLFSLLGERADSILAVYTDQEQQGLHIFSAFSVARYKTYRSPMRSIQYYFFTVATGQRFYKIILQHEMESLSGRSGYKGFSSLETDVLESSNLEKAMEELSSKMNKPVTLGSSVPKGEDNSYTSRSGNLVFSIVKIKGLLRDTMKIECRDGERIVWRKKM